MPPKIGHVKSTGGCLRCKKRKVKCDEKRPSCGACTRHSMPCAYDKKGGSRRQYPIHPPQDPDRHTIVTEDIPEMEFRLLHYWTAYTSQTFTSSLNFFRNWVPLVAFRHRQVLDGVLAFAALHLYRQTGYPGATAEGEKALDQQAPLTAEAEAVITGVHAGFLGNFTRSQIRRASAKYFQRAVKSHRESMRNLDAADLEAVFLASVLIMFMSLFSHDAFDEDEEMDSANEQQWFQLGSGPRTIMEEARRRTGCDITRISGLLYTHPDLSDNRTLFDPAHQKPFKHLINWKPEELEDDADNRAYQQTLSYIGLIYLCITQQSESPRATSRRIAAVPSRLPNRFCEMVLAQRPRALAMLAYLFACTRMLSVDIPWYNGLAEKRIPSIDARLPPSWKLLMAWPAAVLAWVPTGDLPAPVP